MKNFDWIWASDFALWGTIIFALTYYFAEKYALTVGVAFGFTLLAGLLSFQSTLNALPMDEAVRLFAMTSLSAIVSVLLTVFAARLFTIDRWKMIFKLVALANAVAILLSRAIMWHEVPWGILFNGSMSGCFSAVLFPLFSKRERWQRVAVALSVFAAGRSLPIAVFLSVILSFLILNRRDKLGAWFTPLFIGLGFAMKGMSFLDNNGRFDVWSKTFEFFKHNVAFWKGAGLGSFYVWGQVITQGQFIWLHSDWLQIGFELGVFGFISVVIMYIHALMKAHRRVDLFSALIGFGVFAVANMPLRYPIAGLYGAFLIRWAFEKQEFSTGSGIWTAGVDFGFSDETRIFAQMAAGGGCASNSVGSSVGVGVHRGGGRVGVGSARMVPPFIDSLD